MVLLKKVYTNSMEMPLSSNRGNSGTIEQYIRLTSNRFSDGIYALPFRLKPALRVADDFT
jgi:hypothetical protein